MFWIKSNYHARSLLYISWHFVGGAARKATRSTKHKHAHQIWWQTAWWMLRYVALEWSAEQMDIWTDSRTGTAVLGAKTEIFWWQRSQILTTTTNMQCVAAEPFCMSDGLVDSYLLRCLLMWDEVVCGNQLGLDYSKDQVLCVDKCLNLRLATKYNENLLMSWSADQQTPC